MKPAIPNKLLGQHFLTCEWVLPELAKAAELTAGDTVLEIGPGTGVLTRFLASRAKKVIAVEKDTALAKDLADQLGQTKTHLDHSKHFSDDRQQFVKNVEIITGDILRFDFSTLPNKYKVVANIPYYLTSRLIRILLELEKKPHIIVLTIQKEVAERIVARPPDMNPAPFADKKPNAGSTHRKGCGMNILALSAQAYGTSEIIAHVPASCFNPQPKVDSAILKISNISENFFIKHHIAPKDFFTLIKAGFSSGRKVLTNNLQRFTPKKDLAQALISIGHPALARAQELSLEDWAKLARLLNLL